MAQERKNYEFPDQSPLQTAPEIRSAKALEFIAYYLDRIDAHLERLADAVESQKATAMLRTDLKGIAQILARK
jgi:hypothetical protein